MARQAIVVHVDHGKTSLTAAITKVLAEHSFEDVEIIVAAPEVREIEHRPTADFELPTPREMYVAGLKTRGTKRTDVPRPKDQYRQRGKGFRNG